MAIAPIGSRPFEFDPEDKFSRLEKKLVLGIFHELSSSDHYELEKVSRLFNQLTKQLFSHYRVRWINLVAQTLFGGEEERFIRKTLHAFVYQILGPTGLAQLDRIGHVDAETMSDLLVNWKACAPEKPLVVGITFDDSYNGGHLPFLAFSVKTDDRKSRAANYAIVVVKDKRDEPVATEKVDYLKRLLAKEPCGYWSGDYSTEGPREIKEHSAVELSTPDFPDVRGMRVYFLGYLVILSP
jgi:hypothetical protein